MSKRFTDSEKYKNPFIRGLQGAYKLLWDYILTNCDNSGIWVVDFEITQIYLGKDMKVNKEDALRYFNSGKQRIFEIDGGEKWFIPSFIEFQYGTLSSENRAHTKIILTLSSLGVLIDGKIDCKGLTRGLQDPMVMVKDKVVVMDKEKVKENGAKIEKKSTAQIAFDLIPDTFKGDEFRILWDDYEKVRKDKKKILTETAVKHRVGQLVKLSGGSWSIAKESMEQSIAGAWDEFFYPKNRNTPIPSGGRYDYERGPVGGHKNDPL